MITTSKPLKQRILTASIWTLGGHIGSQSIRLVSNLIMTRLLVPEMFGLMAIVNVLLIGLVLLTDLGLRQNIIQSKRSQEEIFLNTVWAFQIIRGFFIWTVSVLVAIAVYIAQHYHLISANTVYAESLLPYIIPVATLSTLISSFEPTWTSLASRGLQQSKLVKIEIFSQLAGVVLMVLLALAFKSIWALVIGSLGTSLAQQIIVNFIYKEKRNRFEIDKEALHEIFHFGKWVFLSSVVGFLNNNGDRLLLGGLVSTVELGVYSIAAFIIGAVTMVISRVIVNVAYPALSETSRNNPSDLKRVYYRFRLPFDAGLLFLAGFFLLTGHTIIDILYDHRYQNAGWMLNILALSLISIRYNLTDQCYMALGKPRVMTALIVIRTVTLFVLLPIAFKQFGMQGAVWAIVISGFSSFPAAIYYKKITNLLDIKKELITLPMFLIGLGFGFIFNKLASWLL